MGNVGSDAPQSTGGTGGGGGGGVGGSAGDPQLGGPGPMRLVSWNAWSFFDTKKGNCTNCPYEETLTSAEYKLKVSSVAKGLAQLDGDVVVLQEVENDQVIDDIANSAELAGHGYTVHRLSRGNDPRGMDIGVMSKWAIDDYVSHKTDKFTRTDAPKYVYSYTRDAVEIHLRWGTSKVVVLGIHFKSKAGTDDPDKRVAEAQHTREIADGLLAQDPSTRVFITGDSNDTPGTDMYAALQQGKAGPEFLNAMASVSSADRWSYRYGGANLLIDHMFASPSAAAVLDAASATILHNSTLQDVSDHAPIAATYVIP